ncbi:MAG TPA: SDR family oxidoreductase [Phototrophicaceae bacterium]|nr:SDR family oxidoreductase [Phototrophicaceae bacterium]
MLESLEGKVVLVTGSARRVGRAILLGFAAQGANVVVHHSQSPDEAEATAAAARKLGVEALIVQGDHAYYEEIVANFEQIKAHYGRIDVLVNSASVFQSADLLDVTPDEWNLALDINLRAPFWCTQQAGRLMRAGGIAGSIINIADTSGLRPWAARPQHSVSKAGLIMLTEVTARALAQYGIRANCLVLGPVLPSTGQSEANWRKTEARLPLKRAGDPDDAARAAIFLATNDYVTGAALRVDGGEYLGAVTEE